MTSWAELGRALHGRTRIVGIGHPLRGDDGAGPALIRLLQGRVSASLLDVSEVPESYLGEITAGEPELMLLVDAIDFGGAPGALALIEKQALAGRLATTHSAPLSLLMDYLSTSSNGRVLLLGVQPKQTGFGLPLSEEVEAALLPLADWLAAQSPVCQEASS